MQARSRTPAPAGILAAIVVALAIVGALFALRPDLDLAAAAVFAGPDGVFVGDTGLGRAMRHVFESVPFLVLAGMLALHALRRFGHVAIWAPNMAGVLALVLSFALGPGLLVNTVLKDHSHRPRPIQVAEFGGPMHFQPWWSFSGACDRNCSFVSGEGASAFWTAAPALLAPPQVRAGAVVAALLFGVATATLRMAFGGHFLSDTLFAALLTWLVSLGCWKAVALVTGETPRGDPPR